MARYRGPKSKIARRFSDPIFGPDKSLDRKAYPPGQHGPNRRRMKQSEYAIQLIEKQKAKYTYGILEKQFANMFKRASSSKGITGENLLRLCEARLDNTVFRLGMSTTRRGARQLVNHNHVTVNGHVVNIPSYTLRPGDVVAVRERSKSMEVVRNAASVSNASKYAWLDFNVETLTGTYIQNPEREEIPENIKEQLIVELYSK